jgi:two-component system response regulator QseB
VVFPDADPETLTTVAMHVLIAEDDRILGDGLKVGLEQLGWAVDLVRDGTGAQTALERDEMDLVVLDLGLPRKPGIEILRWLRARGDKVPVLVLTAKDGVPDRVAVLNAGADDYVCKPFDLEELRARLRALHRRATFSALPVLRHRNIEVDPAAQSVTVCGRSVSLSRKEFAVLQTLIENAGKVVARHRLMSSVYEFDDEVGSNVLEVHIHNVRRKISSGALKTIRGVGYKLD